jgi:hypothetical protein
MTGLRDYSSRHQTACFKATEVLHLFYRAALSHQYNVANFAKLRLASCLHSSGLRCSCCNVVRLRCVLQPCNLVTAAFRIVLICKTIWGLRLESCFFLWQTHSLIALERFPVLRHDRPDFFLYALSDSRWRWWTTCSAGTLRYWLLKIWVILKKSISLFCCIDIFDLLFVLFDAFWILITFHTSIMSSFIELCVMYSFSWIYETDHHI